MLERKRSMSRRTDIDNAKEDIIAKLETGASRAEICRQYKVKYDTLLTRLKMWEATHLKNPSGKGNEKRKLYKPSELYFGTGKYINSHVLKKKMIKDGLKQHKCEICQLTKWNDKPIPIELDHINGNHHDNRLENLRIICPNCHAQQDTNSGKNIGKHKKLAL